jgi:hypothetical protein
MVRFATDAATVEVGAGITKGAGRVPSPTETELLAVGGEHGVLALGIGNKCGGWFS